MRNALLFGRILRRVGLRADLPAVLDFGRALTLVQLGDREEVKAAGAALFCRRREDLEPYQIAFDRFWRRHTALHEVPAPPSEDALETADERPAGAGDRGERDGTADDAEEEGGEEAAAAMAIAPEAYSAQESLRHRDFDRMTTAELRAAGRLIDQLVPSLEQRRTRRWEVHVHGRTLAPRQMLRRNLGTGGDALTWLWRRPVQRPRSIVLICDISGSMERHSRLLLRFAQALTRSRVPTEAFVFGTRLTRVTHQLRGRDPDLALSRVADAVTDWSGGTRIGASFAEFNRHWARRALRSSGVVVVVSDGWDRGDPALVAAETARLRRSCHRLIWLNPLAGADGYRPLAAGMAAAYPYLDDFLAANDLASLEHLAILLGARDRRRTRKLRRLPTPGATARVTGPGRTGPGLDGHPRGPAAGRPGAAGVTA